MSGHRGLTCSPVALLSPTSARSQQADTLRTLYPYDSEAVRYCAPADSEGQQEGAEQDDGRQEHQHGRVLEQPQQRALQACRSA